MKNAILKKIRVIAPVLMILLLAGCAFSAKRSIIVDALTGTVNVESEGSREALSKGEKLKSGQSVFVAAASDLTLEIDSNKHVYAGENSEFILVAKGTKKVSETYIEVVKGKLVLGLDKKLKEKESFEVESQNANMAVRGTVFIVDILDNNGDPVTKLTVESGTVEVNTVEDGVERTIYVNAGETVILEGAAPGRNRPTSDAYNKREGAGPEVLAIYTDSKGETVKEYFPFLEDYELFTEKDLTWELDLQGHKIELAQDLILNTNVAIYNGKITAGDDCAILNKGTLHLGSDYSGDDNFTIETSILGLTNEGTLHLRQGNFIVHNGVGIDNYGKICPEYSDTDRFDELLSMKAEVEDGASFIVNQGSVLLDNAVINGVGTGMVVNNKDMVLVGCKFTGSPEAMLINNEKANLYATGTIFNVDNEGCVGVKNYGTIVPYGELNPYPDVYYSQGSPLILKVKAGTGLENRGTVNGQVKAYVSGGTAIDNHSEMNTDTNGAFIGIVDGGLLVKNEAGATLGRSYIYVNDGMAVKNAGTYGTSEAYNEIGLISDVYTGTLIDNESTGVINGSLSITGAGLDKATFIDNRGKVAASYLRLSAGLKISSVDNLYDWTDPSNDWIIVSFDPRANYALDQSVVVKDSVLFKDAGNIDIDGVLTGFLLGTGEGTYEFYHASGSGSHNVRSAAIHIYGKNITGFVVDKGIEVNGDETSIQIGTKDENEYNYILTGQLYLTDEGYSPENCTNNIGILNFGNLKFGTEEKLGQHRINLRGSQNIAIKNEGFFTGRPSIGIYGDRNIGLDNTGSMNGYYIDVNINEIGGNIGVRNPGVIQNAELHVGSYFYSNEVDRIENVTSVSAYGKDIGIYNTGTIDCPGRSLTVGNRSHAITGLTSSKYMKVGGFRSSIIRGMGVFLETDSYTHAESLYVGNEGYANNSDTAGTALSIAGQLEVGAGTVPDLEGNYRYGEIHVDAYDNSFTGIYIASGGSLTQIFSEGEGHSIYNATQVSVSNNGNGIINEGHLHLDYPRFTYNTSSGYTKCLTDRGSFSFTGYPDRLKNGYSNGCPGPWYGAEYWSDKR